MGLSIFGSGFVVGSRELELSFGPLRRSRFILDVHVIFEFICKQLTNKANYTIGFLDLNLN